MQHIYQKVALVKKNNLGIILFSKIVRHNVIESEVFRFTKNQNRKNIMDFFRLKLCFKLKICQKRNLNDPREVFFFFFFEITKRIFFSYPTP